MVYHGSIINFPPLPKLATPNFFQAPAGEIFSYVTIEKDGLVFTMTHAQVPKGSGPPAHIHHFASEWFYAPEGGITLYASIKDHTDVNNPPSKEKGDQHTVYLIPLKAGQIFYSPSHRVHGYINTDPVQRPIMDIWKPTADAPVFEPYHDGGTREYFESVFLKVTDPANIKPMDEAGKKRATLESHKFSVPHSAYFLEYINHVESEIPEALHYCENREELDEMIELIKAVNGGDKSVIWH